MDEHFDVGVSLSLNDAVVEELQRAQDRIKTFERAADMRGLSPAALSEIARPIRLEQGKPQSKDWNGGTTVPIDGAAIAPSSTEWGVRAIVTNPPSGALSQRKAMKPVETNEENRRPMATTTGSPPPEPTQLPFANMNSSLPPSEHAQRFEKSTVSVAPINGLGNAATSSLDAASLVMAKHTSSRPTTSALSLPSVGDKQNWTGNENKAETSTIPAISAPTTATLPGESMITAAPSSSSSMYPTSSVTTAPVAPKTFRNTPDSGNTSPTNEAASNSHASSAAQPEEAARGESGKEAPGSHASVGERLSITGDVYLDGALVGKWMSRLLGRDAERASAGPTGFDGRRGRLLPGPTVA